MTYQLVDPSSVLNWQHDWSSDWLATGDTIVSRLWTITPLNVGTPPSPVLTNGTNEVVVVTGLQAGKVYRLTEHVVTAAGLEDDRTIVLRCDHT